MLSRADEQQILKRIESAGCVHMDADGNAFLPCGCPVSIRVVNMLIEDGELVPQSDSLFGDNPQTYIYKGK